MTTPALVSLDGLADLAGLAYLVVFALAALDVVIPVLPSETVVILGGVLSWQGRLNAAALLVIAAAGAITGDHLSYGIGRWTKGAGRFRPEGKVARLHTWAGHQLRVRGLPVLVIARFIPGGRTASTLVSGRLSYPLPRFTPVTIVAGFLWALFGTSLGYLGGTTFHENTLLGTALGTAVGATVALSVELAMRWHRRRAIRRLGTAPPGDSGDDHDLAA